MKRKPGTAQEVIRDRLIALQRRRNFDPDRGAKQVEGSATAIEFGQFKELRELCRILDIHVDLPYDPTGLDSGAKHKSNREYFVYFMRDIGTTTWKVGMSVKPVRRKGQVQVGHDGLLDLRHTVQCADRAAMKTMEAMLKRFLKKKGFHLHGEWFTLYPEYARDLAADLRQRGLDALTQPGVAA